MTEISRRMDPPRVEDGANLADVLLACGVFVLQRARREQVAAQLVAAGVTDAEVRDLHGYVTGCYRNDASAATRWLASLLRDPAKLRASVADLRTHESLRRRNSVGGEHTRGFPSPWRGCTCEGCVRRRAAGAADWSPSC